VDEPVTRTEGGRSEAKNDRQRRGDCELRDAIGEELVVLVLVVARLVVVELVLRVGRLPIGVLLLGALRAIGGGQRKGGLQSGG